MLEVLKNLWETSGFAQFFLDPDGWKSGTGRDDPRLVHPVLSRNQEAV